MSLPDGGGGASPSSSSSQHGQQRRSRRLPRSSSGRDSSRNLGTLLLLTSDRLEIESSRADNAERKATECLTRLRAVLDEKERANHDIARISEELRLYKIQLDVAQKEIFRAQEIVEQVEKARIEAEEDAAKARTVARKLQEECIIMQSREEGRKQGYKEGLRKGRRMGFEEGRVAGYADGQEDRLQDYHYNHREDDRRSARSPPRVVVVEPPERSSSRVSRSRHEPDRVNRNPAPDHIPDVAPFAQILPVPTLTTPSPSLRQPVPLAVPSPAHSPEPIRPRSSSRPTSTISTDGWIPTADRNSFVGVPPPHVLSNPAAILATPHSTARSIHASVADETATLHPQIHSRDYAYAQPTSQPRSSAASRVSTRLSEMDLVSPPPHRSQPASVRSGHGRGRTDARVPVSGGEPARKRSQPEKIAEEWRMANPDLIGQGSPSDMALNDRPAATLTDPRGIVEIPPPVIVAERVELYNNASFPNQTISRPRSPTLERLGRKIKRVLSRAASNASSAPQIKVDPPSTSPSDASTGARVAKHLLSPDNRPHTLPDPSLKIYAPTSPKFTIYAEPPPGTILTDPVKPVLAPSSTPIRGKRKSPKYEEEPIGVAYPNPPVPHRQQHNGESMSRSPGRLSRPISLFSEPTS